MKKVISVIFCFALIFGGGVFAEEIPPEQAAPQAETVQTNEADTAVSSGEQTVLNEVAVNIEIGENGNIYPKNLVLGIYSPEKQFWGANHVWVAEENCKKTMAFSVPEYKKGEKLYLALYSGAENIEYGGKQYKNEEMIELDTAADINIKVSPLKAVPVKAFANEWELYFKNPAKLIDGITMIPLDEYLTAMSMMHCKTESGDKTEVRADGHTVVFYNGGNDMYADGKVTYTNAVPTIINGSLYVPMRFLIEGLGGKISVNNRDGLLNVTANYHFSGLKPSEYKVRNIKSRTNYLIWVSRKDFTVTVFENKSGTWAEQRVFPCSVGAPSTPTVTGEFDYFSKEKRWTYPTYYVGPIMRFYSGYALHSTLLRYDGSNADGRLGKRISHGCVRLRPDDINWMADTIPLYTKVYVTE